MTALASPSSCNDLTGVHAAGGRISRYGLRRTRSATIPRHGQRAMRRGCESEPALRQPRTGDGDDGHLDEAAWPVRRFPNSTTREPPAGSDRRAFMMRSALAVAIARADRPPDGRLRADAAGQGAARAAIPASTWSKKSEGPGDDPVDEFYKVGPGPSSSHTIGPMRITYDFYQRCTKLPAAQLAQATALKVNLFGSLSATGKGHGTERAALAGIVGKEPATIDPAFLDELAAEPEPGLPGEARRQDDQRLAEGHHLRRTQGRLPAPQHHDLQADGRRQGAAGAGILFGRRRLHRVEGLHAAEEERAEISL